MNWAIVFWMVFIISVILYGYNGFFRTSANSPSDRWGAGAGLLLFLLIALLGWKVFPFQ